MAMRQRSGLVFPVRMHIHRFVKINWKYEFAGDTDAALVEDIELNCSSSSKEKKNCYKFDFVPLR